MANMWVYKNNSKDKRSQGDFADFFAEAGGRPHEWGVLGATMDEKRNRGTWAMMRPKDWVVLYQTDRRAIIGVATVDAIEPAEDGAQLVLRPRNSPFDPALNVDKLKKADPDFAKVAAFRPGPRIALRPVSRSEEPALRHVCGLPPLKPQRP